MKKIKKKGCEMMKPVVIHTGRSYPIAEREARERSEEYFKVGRLHMVPPDELSERAKIKFQQIVQEAFWLDELSIDLLAAYCNAWDRWLDCVAAMDGTSDVLMQENAKGEMVAKQNPYRYGLRAYVTMMEELSAKLGLGNIDRLRLAAPVPEKEAVEMKVENPFEEFMAKVE